MRGRNGFLWILIFWQLLSCAAITFCFVDINQPIVSLKAIHVSSGARWLCYSLFFSDGDMEWEEEMECPTYSPPVEDDASDFDFLLQQAQQKLRHKR